jgi:hypothetical protein
MIDAGQNARGRIWLPTDVPVMHDENAWFTHEIQVIADGPTPGSMIWAWIDKGGAPYAPRPCQQAGGTDADTDSTAGTGGGATQIGALPALEVRIQTLERLVSAQAREIADLKARPAAGAMPQEIALKTAHGTYLTAEPDGRVTNREDHPAAWQTMTVEAMD